MRFSCQLIVSYAFMITIRPSLTYRTRVDRTFNIHLTRNKRLFVFPKSSTFSVGMATAKKIVNPSPQSTNIIVGIGNAYDLPTSIEGWRPKFFRTHAKTTKPPTKGTVYVDHGDDNLIYHDYPSWHSAEHFHDDVVINSKPMIESFPLIQEKSHPKIWSSRPSYKDMIVTPPIMSHFAQKDHIPTKMLGSSFPEWHASETIPIHDEWFYKNGHRQKRKIFNNIEKIAQKFGMHIKPCILRVICEAKHFLLPPGKSLIQDVIRILFGTPTKSHVKDEYSEAGQHHSKDCKRLYYDDCPVSLIEFVLHNHSKVSK